VERENPSACATVNWKVCISAIALYCLCVSVTKSEYVTQLLINLIIRTRTRLISGMYHPRSHNMVVSIFVFILKIFCCIDGPMYMIIEHTTECKP
jgi:hypothetical protein